jgi:V/A-type H+-transporting ATPase subunit A
VFGRLARILRTPMTFKEKGDARQFFQRLVQTTRDWNRAAAGTDEFRGLEARIEKMVEEVADYG